MQPSGIDQSGTKIHTAFLNSPLGPIAVTADDYGVLAVRYVDSLGLSSPFLPSCLSQALAELTEYFAGRRQEFTVPLQLGGTQFQQLVWAKLAAIPFGATTSYAAVAASLDRPRAVRAVGAANGRNIINIIIPCHRVIGKDGSLTGYGGGLERKEWLLAHEQAGLRDR